MHNDFPDHDVAEEPIGHDTRERHPAVEQEGRHQSALSRRMLIAAVGVGAGAAAVASRIALAQAPPGPAAPPSTITNPPRDFGPHGAPTT